MADLMRPNHVRVMVHMCLTPALAAASYGPVASPRTQASAALAASCLTRPILRRQIPPGGHRQARGAGP